MAWLDERPTPRVDFNWLATFSYEGQRLPLMDRQRGIRKPAGMDAALAIRTTFTPPNQLPPYNDEIGADGLQRYKYRGTDPHHPENVALRRAMEQRLPLIWFVGVASGLYEPIYPVYVIGEEQAELQFALAVDEGQRFITPGTPMDDTTRRYVERTTRARLHQRVFRMQVLLAYTDSCAVCRLKHPTLLDAAHIIGDAEEGEPVVPNGMSMCKIHHAAFDQNFLGVSPDLTVAINRDLMEEVDGPMLKHGLQEMHGIRLHVPTSRAQRPDPERLAARYETFLAG
ncbi:HNH endonuclease [Nocardioides xinjiangensis]|uniref:HNH endonuclease n=1 Tax=Nocardioides xinjiangensis TaxID=2817376 RepID=UPI001B302162|nr:HNH endonuclease [Nocardioides sp. SYSU D00514]